MAELDIGKHCEVETCNLKDFLPFTCDSCSRVYCVDHRSRESHSCPEVPVQREGVVVPDHTTHTCTFQQCKIRDIMPMVCSHCEKHFCLAHRHQDDHNCEKLVEQKPRMSATKELVQKIVESKKNAPPSGRRKGAKNSATAAKVALMKLKQCATGDKAVPQTERVYFRVYLPKESRDASLPMYFCSKWTVGKVIDNAAALAGLKNNNNMLTAKKLRMCHPETGVAVVMSSTLLSQMEDSEWPLINGGNLILEYLDGESSGVENVGEYIT